MSFRSSAQPRFQLFPATGILTFIVTCPLGLEGLQADQIRSEFPYLNLNRVEPGFIEIHLKVRDVHSGKKDSDSDQRYKIDRSVPEPWSTIFEFSKKLRFANRIYYKLFSGKMLRAEDLYEGAKKFPWEHLVHYNETFYIDSVVTKSNLFKSRMFAHQVLKDAIVDTIRDRCDGQRPSLTKENPDYSFTLFIEKLQYSVALDLSGEPLYRRHYKTEEAFHKAPLKENIASALAELTLSSSQDSPRRILDPFCGSGTLLIESFFGFHGIPVGLFRHRYAFEKLADFPRHHWQKYEASLSDAYEKHLVDLSGMKIQWRGSDIDGRTVEKTQNSIARLGLDPWILVEKKDFRECLRQKDEGQVILTNPPFDIRVASDSHLLRDFSYAVKHEFKTGLCGVFTLSAEYQKELGFRPDRALKVVNGGQENRLTVFRVY